MDFAKLFNNTNYGQILVVVDQADENDMDNLEQEDPSDYSKVTLTFDPHIEGILQVTTSIILEENSDSVPFSNAYETLQDMDQENAEYTIGLTYTELIKSMSPTSIN